MPKNGVFNLGVVSTQLSLGNLAKTIINLMKLLFLIPAPDWSNELSNLKNAVEVQFESVFERRTIPGLAKLNCESASFGIY